jgi:hypothetical protein
LNEIRRRDIELEERKCLNCNEIFIVNKKLNKKYCSLYCKTVSNYKNKKSKVKKVTKITVTGSFKEEEKRKVRRYISSGLTILQMAEKLGRSYFSVVGYLRRNNIKVKNGIDDQYLKDKLRVKYNVRK